MMQRSGYAMLTLPVSERDHRQGPLTAPATLVEYGDYECPYCGMAHPIVKELKRRLGDQLCFVYRHFPLTQVHQHAEIAAESAEAAGAQGQFWQMHDTLFEHQRALDDVHLVHYANALQLDTDRFKLELAQHLYANRVNEDFLSGVRSGVNGTPTFFVNGLRYDGSYDLASLLTAIEEAMIP
jgi:protein-disulfide isomerase